MLLACADSPGSTHYRHALHWIQMYIFSFPLSRKFKTIYLILTFGIFLFALFSTKIVSQLKNQFYIAIYSYKMYNKLENDTNWSV